MSYGDGFLDDFIDFWDEDYESSSTADSGNKTETTDTARTEADDTWNGYYIKYLSGNNAGTWKLITDFDQGTTKFTHEAFANNVMDEDRYILSKWDETLSNMAAADATPDPEDPEDVLAIEGTSDGAGAHDESATYKMALPTSLASDTYTKCLIRYKVSNANMDAKATLTFSAGSQDITLGNSTTWDVVETDVTASKTITDISMIWFHDSGDADGTYTVYFDYIKICKGVFDFPHLSADGRSGGLYPSFRGGDVLQKIPGRGGQITNKMGLELVEITLRGDMLQGESWGTPFGQYFLDILRNDDWSWFTSDRINCKVRIVEFTPAQDVASGATALYTLVLRQMMYSDIYDDVWDGKDGWLGI